MSDHAGESSEAESGRGDDAAPTLPLASEVPTPEAVVDGDATGVVVWHRKHLRLEDHRALARAVADGDAVLPLFVFDPAFYDDGGLACDARIRFLHEALASLDRLYATVPGRSRTLAAPQSRARLARATPLSPERPTTPEPTPESTAPDSGSASPSNDSSRAAREQSSLAPVAGGLTFGLGDPVTLLSRFVDRGWSVVTMATPTGRYGRRRDERARAALGDAVTFVSGDGLVRDREWSREHWQERVEEWLTAPRHAPEWERGAIRATVATGVTPRAVDDGYGIAPTKRKVPTGTHRAAAAQLSEFVDRIRAYPGNVSAPGDAREGTSGLSPYLNFGLFSVRQVHQYVTEHAPSCRGREMFTSRLVWNMHYNQKLVDWPGWTDRAVNPVLEGVNAEQHDPALVTAWKRGETGFPMVDAAMRCLRATGWLNFRMRAMAASFFAHILQQPWRIGADWFHRHLLDSDVGINYTQWQSQAGLVGKPSQRVYNPRKQVRDHDPDGEWITEYVPELADLPSEFLDRPERTPLAVQEERGVVVGEDYPRPVVDFEARRESFWSRHERRRAAAATALARPEVAKRASLSGGYPAARAIATEHGAADDAGTQVSLDEATAGEDRPTTAPGVPTDIDDAESAGAADERLAPSDGDGDDDAEGADGDRAGANQTSIDAFD